MLLRATALFAALAMAVSVNAQTGKFTKLAKGGKTLYATFKTTEGDIVIKLFSKDAPKTVENFVGLATGEKEWTHPATGAKSKKPLYENVTFHRVIPDFMIQGGCPLGTGTGDPGYTFEDEFGSGRTFDKVGLLAMANRGPATNGCQFFITTAKTPHLNNRHTIFGEVVKGYEIAEKISKVERDGRDKPLKPVIIRKIEISETAPAAK
jgi:peptidyl-prolyl cis-trans isomerase A (cyclophilin A)